MNLAEYTVVIFPIFENKHFYLICYELKNLSCSVIDNMWVDQTVANQSTQLKVVSCIQYIRTFLNVNVY
ncbi:hypothetical protein HanPI659440_Chr02g0043521 [Helianthus annuus]|nr:hypothetical protein HanPI659440_Chr02g0043521 [Helianthus annuus]